MSPAATIAPSAAHLPGASAESIRSHYDHPEAFFRLFLGETMCYSCGLFSGNCSLEEAQLAKLDYHLDAARVGQGASLLDVGCGWGALLVRAVEQRRAARGLGLTLSHAQAESVGARGDSRIDVREQHWAEHSPETPYDAVVSIGAIEHFVRPEDSPSERLATYEAFFRRVRAWLKPSGRLTIQCIARAQGSTRPHILAEDGTFPQSDLPCAWELLRASAGEFELERLVNHRADYIKTLEHWIRGLKANRDRACALVGVARVEEFLRYLRYSAMGFALGRTELLRASFVPVSRR